MNIMEAKRLADDRIYLNEDRHKKPKEMFKFIESLINKENLNDKKTSILDVGCATGEFLFYLHEKFPKASFTGVDVSEAMIEKARQTMPSHSWICEDILTVPYEPKNLYDIVLCVGVLQIFDNIETPLHNLLSCLKKKGSLYVAGIFNVNAVDVITRYRTVTLC